MSVRAVNASSGSARKRASAGAERWARKTWPDETACIGIREPVQSRTCTGFGEFDLVDVVDGPAVGNGQPGRLAELAGERHERGMRDRDEPAGVAEAGRERERSGPEPVARLAGDLFDGALALERGEHPRRGGLREADTTGDVGDPDRPVRERAEHGEGALDALDSGHRTPRGLALSVGRSIIRHGSTMWNPIARRTGAKDHPMAQDGYQDIDLSALADDELVEQMHNDLYDGMAAEITQGTNILLGRGWGPDRVLNDALVEGMRIVGIDFRDGILFVPEVLLAANAMKAGMAILRPLLAETGAQPIGKVVIGTVKGDIHDIGKNLVAMMLEGAGFEVYDLGHQHGRRQVHRRARAAQAGHPRDVRPAHDDDAVHEGRHRGARRGAGSATTTSSWSAARR